MMTIVNNTDYTLLEFSNKLRSQLKVNLHNARVAEIIGSEKAAILLLQLHYWLQTKGVTLSSNKGIWYYSSIEQWRNTFFNWSERSIRNSFKKLEQLDLIKTCHPKSYNGNQTKAYSINFENFFTLIMQVYKKENETLKRYQTELFTEDSYPISTNTNSQCIELSKSKFLIDSIIRTNYNSELANKVGGDKSSIILLYLHNSITKYGKDVNNTESNGLWFYSSIQQLEKQFNWSKTTITNALQSLAKQELVISRRPLKSKGNHIKWYSINFEKFNELLLEVLQIQNTKNLDNGKIIQKKMMFCNNRVSDIHTSVKASGKKQEKHPEKIGHSYIGNNKNKNNNIISNKIITKIEINSRKTSLNTHNSNRQKIFSSNVINITNKMIKQWNLIIRDNNVPLLTSQRRLQLNMIFTKYFCGSMEKWKEFCISINSSKFLMGEKKLGFKAYFDWLIQDQIIERILNKEFGIGDRTPDIVREENERKFKAILQKKQEAERLKARELKQQLLVEKEREENINKFLTNLSEKESRKIKIAFEEDIRSRGKEKYGITAVFFAKDKWQGVGVDFYYQKFIEENYL